MKRNILILTQCISLLSFSFGRPDITMASWENIGLYGGQIHTLAIGSKNSSIIFAGSWAGDGLFKSTDGGINWESIEYFKNAEVFSVAVGDDDQKNIWVAHDVFVAKSIDGGSSWTRCFSTGEEERFCSCVVVHPHVDSILYLGCGGVGTTDSGGALFKTTDGGEHWRKLRLNPGSTVRSIAVRPGKSEEVWVVSGRDYVDEGAIYKSTNGGKSWKKITTGLEESWFDEIVITADDIPTVFVGGGRGVYRGKDGGNNWSHVPINDWPEDSWCRALALDPTDNHTIYAQCYYKFSKSADGGDHWETSDLVLGNARFELLSLGVDPQNPGVLYGGDATLGIIKSENEGASWKMINEGVSANHIFHTALSPRHPHMVAASTMMGVYLREHGSPWEALDYAQSYALAFDQRDGLTLFAGFNGWLGKFDPVSGNATYVEFPEQTVTALAVNPSHPGVLYAGTEWYSLDRGGLYKSTDGGESWKLVMARSSPINVITVNPNNPDTLLAGSGLFYAPVIHGNLYKSTDRGDNWKMTSLGDMVINTIAVNPDNPEIIYVGSGAPAVDNKGGIFKSVDGGSTWKWSGRGLPADCHVVDIDLDSEDTQTLFAATFEDGIFVSKNGGEYWTLLGMSDYWAYDVTFTPREGRDQLQDSSAADQFYTGTASGLYQYNGAGTGMIIGMITDDSSGQGITGAQVVADTGGIAQTERGAYLLVTAAGGCTISVSAEGYSSDSRVVNVVSGECISVDMTLTMLSVPGSVSGTVTDLSSEIPVEGATVVVEPGGYVAGSNAAGAYTLGNVVAGTYAVSAFRDGYAMGRENGISVLGGETQWVNFTLSLLGTGSVEGVITDVISGEKMGDVEVRVTPGNFLTTSDSEGSYIISDIKAGDYTLSVSHQGYLPYRQNQIEVTQDESLTANIALQPCPFSMLGLSRNELKTLRRLRDEILLKHQIGKTVVSSFYQHASSVSRYVFSHPSFKSRLLKLMTQLMPEIEYLLTAKKASITPARIKKMEECLKDLAHTHTLKADIHALIVILRDEKALEQLGIVLEKQLHTLD